MMKTFLRLSSLTQSKAFSSAANVMSWFNYDNKPIQSIYAPKPSVYVPTVKDAHRVLLTLERRGTIGSALIEKLFAAPNEEIETEIEKYLPKHLWNPTLWNIEGTNSPYYLTGDYLHPKGEPIHFENVENVDNYFAENEGAVFLFQNPSDPELSNEFLPPSRFVVSMIDEAQSEMCISVYSMHENRKWKLFTDLIANKLSSNPHFVFRIVCHANRYNDPIIERLQKIKAQKGNRDRLHVRYTVGLEAKRVSSNGSSLPKLYIADKLVAMEGSLNISEPAFTLDMENGTGYRDSVNVMRVQQAFESIWKVSVTHHKRII